MSADQPCLGAPVRQARLRVLGSFELRTSDGADVGVGLAADERRLLAALAVSPGMRTARGLASLLWPTLAADVALGTLLGVQDSLDGLIVERNGRLWLSERVEADLGHALGLLRRWQQSPGELSSAELAELVDLLGHELLPSWSEAWVRQERASLHQVRMRALESLCARLTAQGEHELAIRAGSHVVAAEPLRQDARRALIEAHLAAGNVSEAVHQYEAFAETCARFGVSPSGDLSAFFPPSPAWPVLHVRRPIHVAASVGRGLSFESQHRRVQAGAGAARG
jgi:DNA-binding SARP family transcriptional activator